MKVKRRDSLPILFSVVVITILVIAAIGIRAKAGSEPNQLVVNFTNDDNFVIDNDGEIGFYEITYGDISSEHIANVSLESNPDLPLSPEYNGVITYSSSDPSVAIIDEEGFIKTRSVGSTTITATASDDEYYLGNFSSYELRVVPKEVEIDIDVNEKIYDGSSEAKYTYEIFGVLPNDYEYVFIKDGTGIISFSDIEADTNIPVEITTPFELAGAKANCYTIKSQPSGLTGIILKKSVEISSGIIVHDKEYDGTSDAELILNNAAQVQLNSQLINGDSATLFGTGSFTQKDVKYLEGEIDSIDVHFSSEDLHLDNNNYDLKYTGSLSTSAKIKPRLIKVQEGSITAENKPYDGKEDATLVTSGVQFDRKIDDDILGINATGRFVDSSIKDNKIVYITYNPETPLTGANAKNYCFDYTNSQKTTTASITKEVLTPIISVASGNYVYNGSAQEPAITVKVKVNNDNITLTEGTDYTVEYKDNVNAGNNAKVIVHKKAGSSYNLKDETVQNFTINKRPVIVSNILPSPSETVYSKDLSVSFDTSSVIYKDSDSGETIIDSNLRIEKVNGGIINRNVNTGSTSDNVKITGVELSTSAKQNYSITKYQTSARVEITPRNITNELSVDTGGPYTYTGKAFKPSIKVSYDNETISTSKYSNSLSTSITDAGTYDFTLESSSGGNYEFTYNGSITVNKATTIAKTPKTSMTITSTTIDPDSLLKSYSGWEWAQTPDFTNMKSGTSITAKAVYSGNGEENYEESAKNVTVTITLKSTNSDIQSPAKATSPGSGGTNNRTSGSSTTASRSTTTNSKGTGTGTGTGSGSSSRTSSGLAGLGSGSNSSNTEAQPPFIEGSPDVSGWDAIELRLSGTATGDSVPVYMNGTTKVPSSLLNSLKDRNVTLVLDMGNSIKWNINGMCIPAEIADNVDFSIVTNTNNIPAELINMVSTSDYKMQLNLAHSGDFGCAPILTLNLGSNNAGLYANLFYYDQEPNNLEFVTADEISEDGTASLTFTHASDYVIIVDKDILANVSVHLDKPAAAETEDKPDAGASNLNSIADPNSLDVYVQSTPIEENQVPKSPAIARRMVSQSAKKGVRIFWIILIVLALLIGANTFLFMNRRELKAAASARASKKALSKTTNRISPVQTQGKGKNASNNRKYKKYL